MTDLSSITAADKEQCVAIAAKAGVNLRDCYQCGKCSAGCPMVEDMDLKPREIIRCLQLGLLERALSAKSPWMCADCDVCSTRCPQNVDVANIMNEVRKASKYSGHQPIPEADKFDDIFVNNVRKTGNANEVSLAMKFNFSSGHVFQDVPNSPKMLKRGMLHIGTLKIKDTAAMQKIYDKAMGGDK